MSRKVKGFIRYIIILVVLLLSVSFLIQKCNRSPQAGAGSQSRAFEPEHYFFPTDKAYYGDGTKISLRSWTALSGRKKEKFVIEYMDELERQYNQKLKVDIISWVMLLDDISYECRADRLDAPVVSVIRDLLTQQERLH